MEDREKNIWILNDDGINIYQRKHGTISLLYISDATDSNTNNVSAVIKDPQGEIWIVTNQNIFQYNYNLGKAVLFKNFLNDVNAGIVAAINDREKNIFWILISRDGFYEITCYDYIKNKITYPDDPAIKALLHNYKAIAFFKSDENNNLWVSDYWGTLLRYNTITKKSSQYLISHAMGKEKSRLNYGKIYDCLDDGNGKVWFGGENTGLLKYDKNTASFSTIQYQNGSGYGLHYDQEYI